MVARGAWRLAWRGDRYLEKASLHDGVWVGGQCDTIRYLYPSRFGVSFVLTARDAESSSAALGWQETESLSGPVF